jgi:hypothetical protein
VRSAVEAGKVGEPVGRDPVVDEAFDAVLVRGREIVLEKGFGGDDPLPLAAAVPDELAVGRLVGLAVFLDDEPGGLLRFLRPVADDVGAGRGHIEVSSGVPPESEPRGARWGSAAERFVTPSGVASSGKFKAVTLQNGSFSVQK